MLKGELVGDVKCKYRMQAWELYIPHYDQIYICSSQVLFNQMIVRVDGQKSNNHVDVDISLSNNSSNEK